MDKRKIVFIVDDGLPSGGLYDALKELGDQLHVDIEMMEMKDILQGTKPKLAIWDEGPLPVPERVIDIDYSKLETRVCGKYDTVILGTGPGSPAVTVTGRRPSEPEFQPIPGLYGCNMPSRRYGKSILQQDLHAMLVEGMHEADRNLAKLLYPTGQGVGGFLRYGKMSVPWDVANNGADHPSRKREPKGPRGKWGKLK